MNNNYVSILKYAMNLEKTGKEFYTMYKDKVQAPSNIEIFTYLSEMEDEHFDILAKQLEDYEKGGKITPLKAEYIEDDGDELFKKGKKELSEMDFSKVVDDLPILRMAYAMENDFAEFYQKAAKDATDPEAKKLLETLAKWEYVHRDFFFEEIEDALQENMFSNGFSPF